MNHAPDWLINSFIYLSAAVVAVPLAKKFGLGSIIGYLAAGIAIGPWGLGLVTNVQDILHFAEFGVVLMLFLIGMELEPKRLWSLRRPIFGWGSAQMLSCAALLTGTAMAFGIAWQTALVAGLGLALSSTAIALQSIHERNLMRTSSGQAGFSILLFQDVAAIPILALMPLLATIEGSNEALAQPHRALEALKIIAVIAGIILGGRLLLRPVLRWIANSGTPEIFTAASLLLVVGIAALMQLVGLSMALGAFLAGVLLAESEYRRELQTDIEPFKALLLGLFFIAVGMSIDFGVLWKFPGQMLAILAGFLGLKLLAIYALATAMKLPWQERPVFALLLAQGGEFAFVVFQAAAGARVFSSETASLLIGAVALSMLISPLLLVAIDKLLLPRYAKGKKPTLEEISEPQEAPVIIAGFGRYGQIVGRMLLAQGISATVLDHDADMIETIRTFGYRVFYGDATRLDLLRTAGAAQAKILVLSVDNVEQSLKIVDIVHAHFPQLQIVARARDVPHWNALRDRGVMRVERELFDSSLRSARTVLELLGQPAPAAQQAAERFRQHNLALFEQMYPHRNDREQFIAVAKQGRMQLEAQMKLEREQLVRQAQDARAEIVIK
ncbi:MULTISPECIES: glutathione-regulated potassium-efflux system protein KefC [unclassified Polaromonas]|jgi:glutathione-regulated potassium-efflux system ancillary protein KefC|uniref:glutathione-regulated potassium-efflux system protein KefC n=1 Tax=unclassified Polaromonas TaxID=2638319 RepID=UPI0018CA1AFA|nr:MULTISPECIES: glutathione-regulated potassium-efflux system protein KefC [unclassified Polaromonas]MBG6071952.1 glutathione-regulated potassium-efflux system ancillary protein KefC [Polaromonas sp. CG_9.7]MBG6113954.1 glutathione-regulated potassium-efflux system ancillary protein KefC [Polaromonas sp. CG_9.2]MDH6183872.1 glutathione-regulated potassium-efflux system ancillary protein KefC [Polaromonas sp. CG_23.6]